MLLMAPKAHAKAALKANGNAKAGPKSKAVPKANGKAVSRLEFMIIRKGGDGRLRNRKILSKARFRLYHLFFAELIRQRAHIKAICIKFQPKTTPPNLGRFPFSPPGP